MQETVLGSVAYSKYTAAMRGIHLSIIIPACNCWEATRRCLYSIAEQTPGVFFEVLLVDNGSSDATPVQAPPLGKKLFPGRFRHLRQEENRNFGPACTLGAQQACGDLLLFLNNDTECTPGWYKHLLLAAKTLPRWGALSPLLLYPPTQGRKARVQHLGVAFALDLSVSHLYARFPADHPVTRKQRPLQAISGAALLIERKTFLELEGFYPHYVNGYEDLDLCCQLRRKGLRLHCVPQSVILHHEGLTPGRLDHDATNAALLQQRCAGCFLPDLHRLVVEDGYTMRLAPWLSPVLRLPAEREKELLRHAHDPDALRGALEQEPLWEQGYELLLEQSLQEGERLRLLDDLCFFHPTLQRLEQLQRLAEECNLQSMASHAALRLQGLGVLLQEPDKLERKARGLLSWARKVNDVLLAAILENWLREAPLG